MTCDFMDELLFIGYENHQWGNECTVTVEWDLPLLAL